MAAGLAGGLVGAGAMGLLLELAKSWTGQKQKRASEDATVKAHPRSQRAL